jgi:hypothetical protein
MSLQLERFCDLLSADDFRAIAQAFPGAQTIYVPEGRGRTLKKFQAAIGEEKTAQLIENWGGLQLFVPAVYLRSPLAQPEQLYIELVDNNRPLAEVAEEYKIHPWQLLQLVQDEVRRRRDLEICRNWQVNESTPQLSKRLGVPPNQVRYIANTKRKLLGAAVPDCSQLTLFSAS